MTSCVVAELPQGGAEQGCGRSWGCGRSQRWRPLQHTAIPSSQPGKDFFFHSLAPLCFMDVKMLSVSHAVALLLAAGATLSYDLID